jgi:hypothetical protein
MGASRLFRALALASTAATLVVGSAQAQQAVQPYYGNIRPFYGNLRPFYGNIRPFYGNLNPFYGNLHPFWGNLQPFWGGGGPFSSATDPGAIAFFKTTNSDGFWGTGDSNPYTHNPSGNVQYSQVAGFWASESANWTQVQALWASASTDSDFANVALKLQTMIVSPASSFWGKALLAGTHTTTFAAALAKTPVANTGLKFNSDGSIDPQSLKGLDETGQQLLFLTLYDAMMSYSGTGHVDWWMGATGWSPALAQTAAKIAGGGDQPISIGMLDFTVSGNAKAPTGTVMQYGTTIFGDGHGAAVGSLIQSSIDGSKVLGVLPAGDALITVYDPYDQTGSASWSDVGKGVDTLAAGYFKKGDGKEPDVTAQAKTLLGGLDSAVDALSVSFGGPPKVAPAGANLGVINASLGEHGWTLSPGWNTALASGSAKYSILVVAAGNEGIVQPSDISWNFKTSPTVLVVGSVGLDGKISNFSNTPGLTCLIDQATGACDPLKNHFLVAPGELVLVSDGQGGVSRQSGTSLAAPLVTGAIALLEARWPWLANYPNETAAIILQTATPIHSAGYTGSGPDPVYGWGELNIAASQEPLDWNKLYFQQNVKGVPTQMSVAQVLAQVRGGTQSSWDSSKLYFSAIERVGGTYRDFQIPLASTLVGQNVNTLGGQQLQQSYLNAALKSWASGAGSFNSASYEPATARFVATSQPLSQLGDAQLRARITEAQAPLGFADHALPMNIDFALIGPRQMLQFGYGDSATALAGGLGLGGPADFQPGRGGANPFLGLATGGAYVNWRVAVSSKLTLSAGAADRSSLRDGSVMSGTADHGARGLTYAANAQNLGVDYAAADHVVLHAALTRLSEDSGLLGVQSLQAATLGGGSTSNAATFGLDIALSPRLLLSASGTLARTTTGQDQALTTSPGGLVSTSAEIALLRKHVFSAHDSLRVTLSKPMQVVSGQVRYTDFGVVDRETGELGYVTRQADAANGATPLAAEVLYARTLRVGGQMALFLRGAVNTTEFGPTPQDNVMAGYQYKLAF